MKKILILFLMGIMGQAQADIYDTSNLGNFNLAGLNWQTSFDVPLLGSNFGSIETTVGPDPFNLVNPVTIMGSDDPDDPSGDCFFLLCADMLSTMKATSDLEGYLGFDWIFESFDTGGFDQDLFQLTHYDKSETTTTLKTLTGSDGINPIFHELLIGVGDIISLAIYTEFNIDGGALAIISDMEVSASSRIPEVPLPPAFALFGIALAGLGFVRRRKDSLVGAI